MLVKKFSTEKEILANFIIFIFMSTIMLWDYEIFNFKLKYSLILLTPYIVFEIFKDKSKIKFVLYSFLCFVIFFIHLFFSQQDSFQNLILFNNIKIYKLFYFSYIFLCVLFFYNYIIEYKKKFINFFVFIFVITTFISLIFFKNDAPYFCGGLPDLFNLVDYYSYKGEKFPVIEGEFKLSFRHMLYQENSHLGMVVVPLMIYIGVYLVDFKKKIYFFSYIFLISICLIASSATLLIGLISSLIALISISVITKNYKNIYKLSFFLLFILFIFSTSYECTSRIVSLYNLYYNGIINKNLIKKEENKKNIEVEKKESSSSEVLVSSGENLSSEISVHSTKVLLYSLKNKPLGYGFDNYTKAYNDFLLEPQNIFFWRIEGYNKEDGSNNIVKMSTEFGIFSILFYIILILYALDKKIKLENKIFFLPFIITQFIRGAGYFNAGFSVIFFMIIVDYTYTKYLKKK